MDEFNRRMAWFNLVGILLVLGLVGTFVWFHGADFLGFLVLLFRPDLISDH